MTRRRSSATHSFLAREAEFRVRFGDLLTLADVAALLRYPSLLAARKALARGQLPVKLVRLPNRRGWFTPVGAVARFLDELERQVANEFAMEHNHTSNSKERNRDLEQNS